jgi:group II intron reverse transcriptase/maturase
MNRMLISNLSQRLGFMTKCFNRNRTFVRACESRRNRYQELPLTAPIALDVICTIKGILRVNIPVVAVTVGLPKSRKRYGNGGLIVAATQNTSFCNTSKVMFRECEVIQRRKLTTSSLGMGHKKLVQDLNNKFYQDKICSPERLIQAYEFVSKNKGSNTKGVDSETLDIYPKDMIYSVSSSLKDHSFKFKPIRQVEIPKPNGGIRKLSIPGPRDKVVQKVMTMALEEIYEPKFLNSSHGFRPKKGTHSALNSVTRWAGTKWFIEGEISKCFDTLDRHILEQLLKKEIFSKPFIDLYWKVMKSDYINPVNKVKEFNTVGVPQGGVLSPILSNIYLHELDKFMQIIVDESNKSGPTSIDNSEYKNVHTKISNMRQYFLPTDRDNRNSTKKQERLKEILKLEKVRAKYPSTIQGPGYRVYYVRYADDFLIGIDGPRRMAEELKQKLQKFLLNELKLTLNLEKTKITRSDYGAYFLGARLKRYTSRTNDQKRRATSVTKTGRKVRARVAHGSILALVPFEHLVQKLQSQGMCKIRSLRTHDVIPTRKTAWINLELFTIVKKYNDVWQGLLNYYSFAYNRCQLNWIQYLLHHSLACTFMNKLKLNSRRQVFKKYGNTIQVRDKNGKLIAFKLKKNLSKIDKFSNDSLPYSFETFK